ncbi:hypothetical protein [Parvimonas micra]
MNLLEKVATTQLRKTGEKKKLSIHGRGNENYDVYAIPLEYLYYNDHNGRINTMYKKYSSVNGLLIPEHGDSEYNKIFEKFIYESNKQAMEDTKQSIDDKSQQEPGVVLSDGRVIDGNRRFTALRMIEKETGIRQEFNAIILDLDANSKCDEKIIKELELDLQLGREERISYNPIDRIFDVYNTIKVEKIMTIEEYKKASGAKNTRGINRDIRLAELIIKFIEIVSPRGKAIDKFYLARELKLDGPIEEIESTITNLKSKCKESIKEAALVYLAVSKTVDNESDSTRVMRDLKNNILQNDETLEYFLDSANNKVDVIMDEFEDKPIQSASELKTIVIQNDEVQRQAHSLIQSTKRLINKGKIENDRRRALVELENLRDSLLEIRVDDFEELTVDEILDAKDIIMEIKDILYRLKKEI